MLISGGQTGVDRAALDFAMTAGIPCAGWCPAGRRAEDGRIPDRYQLKEASSATYQQRTRLNVKDADATLIFTAPVQSRGTALTAECCHALRRPFMVVDIAAGYITRNGQNPQEEQTDATNLSEPVKKVMKPEKILAWLHLVKPSILNIAGPRASECPEAAEIVVSFLSTLLTRSDRTAPAWPPPRPFTPDLPL